MADDNPVAVLLEDESKIVTKFLLDTCRLNQPSRHNVLGALALSACAAIGLCVHQSDHDEQIRTHVGDESEGILLITGSSAEFYIQPMLSHVGDVDVMMHRSTALAIPEGDPPPTELPAEFRRRVLVYEIIDSKSPCYVHLTTSYLLTEDSDTGKYRAICLQPDKRKYVSQITFRYHHSLGEAHGPALAMHDVKKKFPVDGVYCVRCLSWPSQAADWPTRHRNYGWPDSATVDRVLSIGCDMVQLADRHCREDEWLSWYQSRLSFSRAEIVLLNSWMPVQQIVYHAVRVFIKTDIAECSETKTFSNYHIKTLTLWACERKPKSWWADDSNIVKICVILLHRLAVCLKNKNCRHYFVNDCNLVDDTVHSGIAGQLASITQPWLSTWFVNNYLRKCARLCPDRVSRLFDDISTSTKLQNAVSAVVDWRRDRPNVLEDLWGVCSEAEFYVSLVVSMFPLTVRSIGYWINELAKIDSCLHKYVTAVAFLHVAIRRANGLLSDELLDVLATLVGQFDGKRRVGNQPSSELSLSQAIILMKVVGNTSHSIVQQIEFELSKAYLRRALRCKDSDSDSIYCLANVYLAALYYTSGQYQMAIEHCTLVLRSQDHSKCSSRVVQGHLLPKIDDDIDIVLGLAVFYQHVLTAALNQQQTHYVSVFTTEVLAHYLHVRCMSVMKCRQFAQMPSTDEVQRHSKYIIHGDQLSISDVLLVKSIAMLSEHYCHYDPPPEQCHESTASAAEQSTSELVELLQRSALEHLTNFRQLTAQRFGSVSTIVTTDFEALYAYKRGDYQRCLQLSTQNVGTLLSSPSSSVEGANSTMSNIAPSVSTFPEFMQLMDDDIVSLTAVTMIFNPRCRLDVNHGVFIAQLTLSLHLMTQCQLKLHNSVTSLSQTLDYIEIAHRRCPRERTLDHLTLKLTERKIMMYLQKVK